MSRAAFIDGSIVSLTEFLERAEQMLMPSAAGDVESDEQGGAFSDDGLSSGDERAVVPTVREIITEGGRNLALNKHLFVVWLSGANDVELEREADRYNRDVLDPPLDGQEVRQIVASVMKVDRGVDLETRIRQMNEQFALCVVGDKARVVWMNADGSWRFLRTEAFYQLFQNQWVIVGETRKNLGRVWMQHHKRRTFTRIVFEPGSDVGPSTFNIFRGWARQPKEGDCSLFLDHILRNCAQGNEEHARWIRAWLADIFQQPRKKKGTALVLIGPQGCGKSIVGNVVGALLGPHYLLASDEVHVTGRFNAHQEGLLLLHSDEATFAGDHATAARLKDFVTGSTSVIERKGLDAIVLANYARLLVTSEQEWVIPASLVERRFAVFAMGRDKLQDRDYFAQLIDQLENGGYEALLYFLLNYQYDPKELRGIPITDALLEQKQFSLRPEDSWMQDILMCGRLPGDLFGNGECLGDVLYDHYVTHAGKRGVRRRQSETVLGNYLRDKFAGLVERKQIKLTNGQRKVVRAFPSLEEARRLFANSMRADISWGEPYEWLPAEQEGGDDADDPF